MSAPVSAPAVTSPIIKTAIQPVIQPSQMIAPNIPIQYQPVTQPILQPTKTFSPILTPQIPTPTVTSPVFQPATTAAQIQSIQSVVANAATNIALSEAAKVVAPATIQTARLVMPSLNVVVAPTLTKPLVQTLVPTPLFTAHTTFIPNLDYAAQQRAAEEARHKELQAAAAAEAAAKAMAAKAAEAARIQEQQAAEAAKAMAAEAQRLKDEAYKSSQQVAAMQAAANEMQSKIDELKNQLYSQNQTPQDAAVIQDQVQTLTENLAVTESQIPVAEAQAEASSVAAQDLMDQATAIDASVGQSWFSKNKTTLLLLGVVAAGAWYHYYQKNKNQPPEPISTTSGIS
jgi:hypothetical protein